MILQSVCSSSLLGMGLSIQLSVLKQLTLTIAFVIAPVQLTTNDSKTVQGNLESITADSVTVTLADGQQKTIRTDQIASLKFPQSEEKTGPITRLGTIDGSQIAVQDFSFDGKTLTAEPRRQSSIALPAEQLRWLRFYSPSPISDPAWLGLLDESRRNDTLAIRRDEGKLDQIEGLVESISKDRVGFNLDGSSIEAPIKRLEGIVFASNANSSVNSVSITDVYGSVWKAKKIVLDKDAEQLQLSLSDSLVHRIPVAQVRAIQWSGGVTYLAAEEPTASKFAPYISISSTDYQERASVWFGPEGPGDNSIVLHATSQVTYRVGADMKQFAGSFARTAQQKMGGSVTAKILLDDKAIWEQKLDDDKSKGFDLDIEGGRRLTIEVLAGDDGDLGDVVTLNRARLTK